MTLLTFSRPETSPVSSSAVSPTHDQQVQQFQQALTELETLLSDAGLQDDSLALTALGRVRRYFSFFRSAQSERDRRSLSLSLRAELDFIQVAVLSEMGGDVA